MQNDLTDCSRLTSLSLDGLRHRLDKNGLEDAYHLSANQVMSERIALLSMMQESEQFLIGWAMISGHPIYQGESIDIPLETLTAIQYEEEALKHFKRFFLSLAKLDGLYNRPPQQTNNALYMAWYNAGNQIYQQVNFLKNATA